MRGDFADSKGRRHVLPPTDPIVRAGRFGQVSVFVAELIDAVSAPRMTLVVRFLINHVLIAKERAGMFLSLLDRLHLGLMMKISEMQMPSWPQFSSTTYTRDKV